MLYKYGNVAGRAAGNAAAVAIADVRGAPRRLPHICAERGRSARARAALPPAGCANATAGGAAGRACAAAYAPPASQQHNDNDDGDGGDGAAGGRPALRPAFLLEREMVAAYAGCVDTRSLSSRPAPAPCCPPARALSPGQP
eukprot:gene3951-14945_t